MNIMLALVIIALTLGLAMGSLLVKLTQFLKKWRKDFYVTVNENTGDLDYFYAKSKPDHIKLLAADVPLTGEFRYSHKGRAAFIINTAVGLPVRAKLGEFITLTGERLREIRKGIKIKLIASANAADLEALAKYALMGIMVVGVLLLGAVIMIFKVMKNTSG